MLSLILNVHVRILVPFQRANYLYERPEVHLDQKYILWASKDQWTHSTKIWVSYILGMVSRTYIISFKSQEGPCEIITVSIFQMEWRDFPQGMPASKSTATGGFVMSRPTWWAEQHFPEFSSLCVFIAGDGGGATKDILRLIGKGGVEPEPCGGLHSAGLCKAPRCCWSSPARVTCWPSLPGATLFSPQVLQMWLSSLTKSALPSLTGHHILKFGAWRWADIGSPLSLDLSVLLLPTLWTVFSLSDCLPCGRQAPALESKRIALQRPFNQLPQLQKVRSLLRTQGFAFCDRTPIIDRSPNLKTKQTKKKTKKQKTTMWPDGNNLIIHL